jgi:hypothetical protein
VDSPDHYSADCRCDIALTRCTRRVKRCACISWPSRRRGEACCCGCPPHVWEEKAGIVRIQTDEPNPASPLGYCEIGHWKLDNRGWLVVRNEDGAVLRECRLEPGQDPAAMAAKLLRASWSESRESDFGRRLEYPDDSWMA